MNLEPPQTSDYKHGSQESGNLHEFAGNRSASPPPFQLTSADDGVGAENAQEGSDHALQGEGDLLSEGQVAAALAFYAEDPEAYPRDLVKRLQAKIGIATTGDLDTATIQALAVFQKKHGFPVNGMLDSYTLPKVFAFGLATEEAQESYLGKYLQIDWESKKSGEEKMGAFVGLINSQLVANKVPPVRGLGSKLGSAAAEFRFKHWAIAFDLQNVALNTSNPDGIDKLAKYALHEARHVEQFFAIAQRTAGFGLLADEIANLLEIPIHIAEKAVQSPLKDRSPESLVAGEWWASLFGTESDHRANTLKNLSSNQSDSNQSAYEALPEESDAFRVMREFDAKLSESRAK